MANTNNETLNTSSHEAHSSVDLSDYETAFKELTERDPELTSLIEKAQHMQAEGNIKEIEGYVASGDDKDVIAYKGMALKLRHGDAGLSVHHSEYKTTGTRALARNIVLRRWEKLKKEATQQ